MAKLSHQFLKHLLIAFVLCVFSFFFLDKPIAIFMSHFNHFGDHLLGNSDFTGALTTAVYYLIVALMAWYAFERIIIKKKNKRIQCIGLISLTFPVAFFIKTNLQILFGRMPPRYLDDNHLLFLRKEDLYGFHPFQMGSFPSGHMTIFTAALTMLCYFYPRRKPLVITLLLILALLLLYYNYHFLSDIIAGTYLGVFIATVIYRLYVLDHTPNGQVRTIKKKAHLQNADIK